MDHGLLPSKLGVGVKKKRGGDLVYEEFRETSASDHLCGAKGIFTCRINEFDASDRW